LRVLPAASFGFDDLFDVGGIDVSEAAEIAAVGTESRFSCGTAAFGDACPYSNLNLQPKKAPSR